MDDHWGAEPPLVAAKVRLRDVLKQRKTVIDYTYDFGDFWEHLLTVSNVRAGQPGISYPRYIGGRKKRTARKLRRHPGFLRTARRNC